MTLPASFLIFLFGLLVYIGTFFLIQNRLAEVTITPETLIELGQTIGRDFSGLSGAEFRLMATIYSAQTTLTTFFVLAGVMLMDFAARRSNG